MITINDFYAIDLIDDKGLERLEKLAEQLLKERDAYREVAWREKYWLGGRTSKECLDRVDTEAQRIIEQRNQSKQSKNGGEND